MIGRLLEGARAYVAVRGGCALSGPNEVVVGADPGTPATSQAASRAVAGDVVRVWPGPRLGWFEPGAWERLMVAPWDVVSTSRVGARLMGEPVRRAVHGELPSEGLVEGALQVPPDGQPIIMLADHPVTGGYPVVAVVDPRDLHVVAQAAAGTTLRLRPA